MRYINEFPDWWPQVMGLDIETEASEYPDPFNSDIAVVQVSTPEDVYIFTKGFEFLRPMLGDSSILKIIHNANFDMRYLQHQLGCSIDNVWDSFLMERILTAGTGLRCGLGATIWRRAGTLVDKDEGIRKSFIPKKELTERQLQYVEDDVKYLHAIYEAQSVEIEGHNLERIADLEHELLPIIVNMELTGIHLDENIWNEIMVEELCLAEEAAKEMCSALKMPAYTPSLFDDFVPPINLNSWQQVLSAMHQSDIILSDTRDDTLRSYLSKHPDCTAVQAYRDYKKHTKRASWDYPKYINPTTGRVHTNYKQIGADTGRFSSEYPNLQNVPQENQIRRVFVPSDGYLFVIPDFGQQEMRIMAEVSGDAELREVCGHDDPHLANARIIWNRPNMKKLVGKERKVIKGTNFCMNYGGGVKTFAQSAGISFAEGKRIFASLKKAYPKVFSWGEKQRILAREQGYVETIWGRKRWFPGIETDSNLYPNEPINTPIQGTAADMIKWAMVRVNNALRGTGARILLQVHDELVVETPIEIAEEIKQIVKWEMETAASEILSSVSCPVDIKISNCWIK